MLEWLAQKGLLNGDSIEFEVTRTAAATGEVYTIPVSAPLGWFVDTFGPEPPASAAGLKAKDPENRLGWHNHFDVWAAQGILPE